MDWLANNSDSIVAASAIIVSLISLWVAIRALSAQKKHNKLSVKPIAHFSKGDYEDKIFIKLKNYGMGPLQITQFDVVKEKSNFKRLIDSFDGLASKITWNTFTDDIEGRVLAPQNEFTLIEATFNSTELEIRDAIRRSLSKTALKVQYKCIYNEAQPEVQEKLDWFARH